MSRPRVLVVEDEAVVAMDIRQSLTRLGYEVVRVVGSGEAAVVAAGELRPDVALMDIHLRGDMDGIEAAGILRTRYAVPVVFLTAFTDDDTIQRARLSQPFGYLMKPFEERELRTTIEITLQAHQAETEMRKARDAAEQAARAQEGANQAKARFLSTVTHELRTPVSTILGFSQVLAEMPPGSLSDSKAREFLRNIHSAGLHLLDMINDLLDLASFEAGRLELHPEVFNLAEHIRVVGDGLYPLAQAASLSLELPDEDLGQVEADPRRFRQILTNLLANAIKFSLPGGRITVEVMRREHEICIDVSDTGIGIATEDQTRIFEAFERVVGGGVPREGVGLGLAITRQLVQAHQGTLQLSSTCGEGSRFSVVLPQPIPSRRVNGKPA